MYLVICIEDGQAVLVEEYETLEAVEEDHGEVDVVEVTIKGDERPRVWNVPAERDSDGSYIVVRTD